MADAFNEATEQLRAALAEVTDSARTLVTSSEHLSGVSHRLGVTRTAPRPRPRG
jgi:hypothetical protein